MALRPQLEDIRAAAQGLRDVIVRTPLVSFPSTIDGRDIRIKPEILQPIGSFKLRGVFWAVAALDEDQRRRGISTVSAGNTAQALAWSARHFGVEARAIMPETAPQTKIDAVRALGGTPVLVPRDEVFRYMSERLWQNEPYSYICPWTNPLVHCGHGTLGLEIAEDLDEPFTVYVPVGGGGLLCGVGSAIAAACPDARIVAVEPEGCPALHASIAAGEPTCVECVTMCDGVAVPYMTDEMFPVLCDLVDDVVLVSEDAVRDSIRRLALDQKIIVEGSGALSLAAALQSDDDANPAVCIATGGSIDPTVLVEILAPGH